MSTDARLDKIIGACEWISAKGGGASVTTSVKWCDWGRKQFSPAMAVLWYSEVSQKNDGYDTFRIPDSNVWVPKISEFLLADEQWVRDFVDQCYNGVVCPTRYTLSVMFDGFDKDHSGSYSNVRLRSPRIEWKQDEEVVGPLLPEAEECIRRYESKKKPARAPYWTKDPPVALYEGKLISAVYDLFCALEEKKRQSERK